MIPNRILFGRGAQPYRIIPTNRLHTPTRVASATYSIVDMTEGQTSADREVVASTAATLDSPNTTISAAAGRDQANASTVTATSASGITEGHSLLLTATDGSQRELIEVAGISGTTVTTRHPIRGIYASGSALQGIELSGTFPAAVANDEDLAIDDGREYQITFVYTIDSEVEQVTERIRVERYGITPWITVQDVIRGHASLARTTDPGAMHDALALATEEVAGELEASRIRPEYYRPTLSGKQAVRYLALHYLYLEKHGETDRDMADLYRERFKAQILKMIEGRPEGARIIDRKDDTTKTQGDTLDILVPT